jgi:hypothetical protein
MYNAYTKSTQNRPKGHNIYQHFKVQDPPNFTQIGIFGLKTNHLATQTKTFQFGGSKMYLPTGLPDFLGTIYQHGEK